MVNFQMNEQEAKVLHYVLESLLVQPYAELNKTYGSIDIEDMAHMRNRLFDQLIDLGLKEDPMAEF